jgi:hypothetical protein
MVVSERYGIFAVEAGIAKIVGIIHNRSKFLLGEVFETVHFQIFPCLLDVVR